MKRQDEISEALAELARANSGVVTPDAVVAAAASESSPLHTLFEWDNGKAGHFHRLNQARTIIRSVRVDVTIDRSTVSTVFYVRNPDAEADEQGYISVSSLQNDRERARVALSAEFERAASCLRRARELGMALGLESEIEMATEAVLALKVKFEELRPTQ